MDMKTIKKEHSRVLLSRPVVDGKPRYQVHCSCGRHGEIGSRKLAELDQKNHRMEQRQGYIYSPSTRTPAQKVTPDAPDAWAWRRWEEWFRQLLPEGARFHRCCIGIPDEPEPHVWVSWVIGGRTGWEVKQVASWFEIRSGATRIVTPRHDPYPFRRIVAILRVLGALPS